MRGRWSRVVARCQAGAVLFAVDDRGQDLIEYALLTGAIGTVGMLLYPVIAGKMGAAYVGWQAAAQALWEPCAPAAGACP